MCLIAWAGSCWTQMSTPGRPKTRIAPVLVPMAQIFCTGSNANAVGFSGKPCRATWANEKWCGLSWPPNSAPLSRPPLWLRALSLVCWFERIVSSTLRRNPPFFILQICVCVCRLQKFAFVSKTVTRFGWAQKRVSQSCPVVELGRCLVKLQIVSM